MAKEIPAVVTDTAPKTDKADDKVVTKADGPVAVKASSAQYYKIYPTVARTYDDSKGESGMVFTKESPFVTNDPIILEACRKNGYLTMDKTDISRVKKVKRNAN